MARNTTQIKFGCITYTQPGVYEYTIKEDTVSADGWTTDKRTFPVTVTITDVKGKLVSAIDYPNGTPEFVNSYQAEPTSVCLTANKTVTGQPTVDADFDFGVYDLTGTRVVSGTLDATPTPKPKPLPNPPPIPTP